MTPTKARPGVIRPVVPPRPDSSRTRFSPPSVRRPGLYTGTGDEVRKARSLASSEGAPSRVQGGLGLVSPSR